MNPENLEIPMPEHNWKFAVGFVIGVIVTLVIIVVLANKFGKEPSVTSSVPPPPSDAGATAVPSEPQLALPEVVTPEAPAAAETYMPAPF